MGDSFLSRLTGGLVGGAAAGAGGKTGGAHSQGYRTAGGQALDPIAEARAMSARSNAARRPSSAFALSDSGFNSFRGSLSAGWKAELVSWRFRQAVLAELVGTFLFVAIGTLSVMTTLPGSRMDGLARQEGIPYQMRVALTAVVTRFMSISFVFGLALVVLIFALGSEDGRREGEWDGRGGGHSGPARPARSPAVHVPDAACAVVHLPLNATDRPLLLLLLPCPPTRARARAHRTPTPQTSRAATSTPP